MSNENVSISDAIMLSVRDSIDSKLPSQLSTDKKPSSLESLFIQVEAYEKFQDEIVQLLSDSPIENRQLLWIECIYKLVSIHGDLKKKFVDFCSQPNINYGYEQLLHVQAKIQETLKAITGIYKNYLSSENGSRLVARAVDLIGALLDVLEIKVIGSSDETTAQDELLHLVLEHFDLLANTKERVDLLAQLSRSFYILNKSELLLRILPDFNPETPLDLLADGKPINLVDLMNFYRFTAFNLVSLSIAKQTSVEGDYNRQADIYFKILLTFPNLNIGDLSGEDNHDYWNGSIINLQERQEVSYLYILNYLLGLESIHKFLDHTEIFKDESTFLLKTMSLSLSREIEKQASQPGSRHSSVVNISSLNTTVADVDIPFKKLRNLGAVVHDGTYKEKLRLVVDFCEAISASNLELPTLSAKLSSLASVSVKNETTQKAQVAIALVRKLLVLVTLKSALETGGLNHMTRSNLNRLFHFDDVTEALTVKQLLRFEIHEDDVMTFEECTEFKSKKALVDSQLQVIRLTRKLRESV